jgi:hypothetical protein
MRNPFTRRTDARKIRQDTAEIAFLRSHAEHLNNGEETTYTNSAGELSYVANFTKGLPHNGLGEVKASAYRELLKALASGNPDDFEKITLGSNINNPNHRKLRNPQAGLAFDLEGPDAASLAIRPAPRLDSAENSGEMGELYWMALLRDVPFSEYDNNTTHQLVIDAAADLSNNFSDFRGPKENGQVTPATLFRGNTPGDLKGPYISQFLYLPITYGSLRISQRQRTVVSGSDFMTQYNAWLAIQNGEPPTQADQFDAGNMGRRFIRNGRDLANYVHFDALYEAYLNACLILLEMRKGGDLINPAKNFRFDPGNPYFDTKVQDSFGTFGGPHILSLVTEVATRALKAVWFQKWFVHRRLRPEAFGGLVHNQKTGMTSYPIDGEILNSPVLNAIFSQYGTYLLPQAFPEGSPVHPAYGSGHATVAGACVTILKAWFDESQVISNPMVPDAEGLDLVPYMGADKNELTVGGELNKIAANISNGRNIAGVHWRTDFTESVKLGEAIAIGILEEQKGTYNEPHSFTLTKFDGTQITI